MLSLWLLYGVFYLLHHFTVQLLFSGRWTIKYSDNKFTVGADAASVRDGRRLSSSYWPQINAFKKPHVLLPKEAIFLTLRPAALRRSAFTLTISLFNGPDVFALCLRDLSSLKVLLSIAMRLISSLPLHWCS